MRRGPLESRLRGEDGTAGRAAAGEALRATAWCGCGIRRQRCRLRELTRYRISLVRRRRRCDSACARCCCGRESVRATDERVRRAWPRCSRWRSPGGRTRAAWGCKRSTRTCRRAWPDRRGSGRRTATRTIVCALDAMRHWRHARRDDTRGERRHRALSRSGALARYAGLMPRVAGTGGRVRYGSITKRGSAWLRWALVEAAIHGKRRRDALGRWGRQLAEKHGGLKARVALARELCTQIYRTWPRG